MEKSFAVLHDEDSEEEKSINPIRSKFKESSLKYESDSDESTHLSKSNPRDKKPAPLPRNIPNSNRTGRQSVLKLNTEHTSDSDLDETEHDDRHGSAGSFHVPDEYNPNLYHDLEVDAEIKEIFQFILKYMPQQLNLDNKFKPFIPEYLPAVGDIDAFLKVIPPTDGISEEPFEVKNYLGLGVLDEPATSQSDPALLHLQLRATSVNVSHSNDAHMVVKRVDNLEKDAKTIDKWIKDISHLHRSKSSAVVRYSEPMPDIDDLMQEWPQEIENHLKEHGFPIPESEMSLAHYCEIVCDMFQIPYQKNKIHSLHLLFSLYAAIKNSQLYQANINRDGSSSNKEDKEKPDQLFLE